MTDETHSGKAFAQKGPQKYIALSFWLGIILAYQGYASVNDLSRLQVVQQMLGFMQSGLWEPLIYVLLYAVRPLILFPATFLSVASGFVFGPILGVLYTLIATNISSTIAFHVGKFSVQLC